MKRHQQSNSNKPKKERQYILKGNPFNRVDLDHEHRMCSRICNASIPHAYITAQQLEYSLSNLEQIEHGPMGAAKSTQVYPHEKNRVYIVKPKGIPFGKKK